MVRIFTAFLVGFSSLIFFIGNGTAAPTISSVSTVGTLTSGATFTISGTSFSTKATATPISWETFDTQTTTVSGSFLTEPMSAEMGQAWTMLRSNLNGAIRIVDSKAHSGSKSLGIEWYVGGGTINGLGWRGTVPRNELFISFWKYQEGTYNYSIHNYKTMYVFGHDTADTPQAVMYINPAENYISPFSMMNNQANACRDLDVATLGELPLAMRSATVSYDDKKDRWARFSWWIKMNTGDNWDGKAEAWVDGTKYINHANDMRYGCSAGHPASPWYDVRFGYMFQGPAGGSLTDETKRNWIDDVYIDSTPARIELCTSSTITTGTHCEVQIPTSWSDTTIGSTLRLGAIPQSTAQAWMFVFDSDNISSPAYTVALDGAPPSYSVVPSYGSNGTVSPPTTQTLYSGGTLTLTIQANTGYRISSVYGCGGTPISAGDRSGYYTTGAITSDCTVTTTFKSISSNQTLSTVVGKIKIRSNTSSKMRGMQ
jgi:hypothetical protein